MLRHLILVAGLATLTACGDPLSGVDRINEVDLAPKPAAAALPTGEEVAREGFFGTKAASGAAEQVAPEVAPEVVGAPLDPMIGAAAESQVKPQTRAGRLLGFLRGDDKKDTPAAAPVVAEASTDDGQADAVAQAVATSEAEVASAAPQPTEAPVEVAALTPEAAATPVAQPAEPKRRGLFNRKSKAKAARTGPDAREVDYGTVLPYGVIARSCSARGRPLGRKVEKAEARGFALYDSDPGAKGGRTWYITGFGDGCPRQITAANALIGSAALYERLHYGPGGENLAVGDTDKAYAKVKRKVCGTRNGKPCGAKIGKMNKTTFFVTAYERFGNSSRWYEVVVHDGDVLAVALKPNG